MSIDHTIQEMHRRNLHKLRPMPAFGKHKENEAIDEPQYLCPVCGEEIDPDDILIDGRTVQCLHPGQRLAHLVDITHRQRDSGVIHPRCAKSSVCL